MNSRLWLTVAVVVVSVMLLAGCDEKKKESQAGVSAKSPAKSMGPARVRFETNMGDIVIELDESRTPGTVKNFLRYVNEGYYDGTIFHRVINTFMIQGGGFDTDLVEKITHEPIKNEAMNGLSNDRGTIAMARTNDPDSATSQFFINHSDNIALNYKSSSELGYAAFGKVVEGMDVVDAIAKVPTTSKAATTREGKGPFQNVPVENVVIVSAKVVADN